MASFALSVVKFYLFFSILKAWNYNLGHDILRRFDVLPNFSFATSETNRDY